MKSGTRCPHCGAKMVEYRHAFSVGLASGLWRLFSSGGGPLNIKALGLTHNQWGNFQKLRYWDLVERVADSDGGFKGGTWRLSRLGADFVRGRASIARAVITYRGDRVRYDGEEVRFDDFHDGYRTRPQYAADATAHQPGETRSLF